MNLTLRTLLAWLDNTLPPSVVHEIGKQVEESPYAKELVERINKVTRQRSLTTSDTTGPEATDPNLVASYLDSELDPEHVVEYEKKCLTSDVHLAEVASVHQILSLIGQNAKVPAEARHRMYALIKDREAIAPKTRRSEKSPQPGPISEPMQPWVTREPPRRSWYERYGPLAAVVVLMAVLCWSAWMSLKPPRPPAAESVAANQTSALARPAPAAAATNKAAVASVHSGAPDHTEGATKSAATTPESAAESAKERPGAPESPPARAPKAQPKPNLPAGSVGQMATTNGVVLRSNSDPLSPSGRQWERIEPKAALKNQDRLLNLQPFRTTLALGSTQVDLVGESEVWVFTSTPRQAARFTLAQGRVLVHGVDPAVPVEVQLAGRTFVLTLPAGVRVGLERLNRREPGAPTAQAPALRIIVPEGEVRAKVDHSEKSLSGPAAVTF